MRASVAELVHECKKPGGLRIAGPKWRAGLARHEVRPAQKNA